MGTEAAHSENPTDTNKAFFFFFLNGSNIAKYIPYVLCLFSLLFSRCVPLRMPVFSVKDFFLCMHHEVPYHLMYSPHCILWPFISFLFS